MNSNGEVEPVRKVVAEECTQDPQLLGKATSDAIGQLYRNAEEDGLRITAWTVTYEPAPGSPFGEHELTVAAAQTRRKSLGLTVAQMDAQIMELLSQRRSD